jgi:hypothetical protein
LVERPLFLGKTVFAQRNVRREPARRYVLPPECVLHGSGAHETARPSPSDLDAEAGRATQAPWPELRRHHGPSFTTESSPLPCTRRARIDEPALYRRGRACREVDLPDLPSSGSTPSMLLTLTVADRGRSCFNSTPVRVLHQRDEARRASLRWMCAIGSAGSQLPPARFSHAGGASERAKGRIPVSGRFLGDLGAIAKNRNPRRRSKLAGIPGGGELHLDHERDRWSFPALPVHLRSPVLGPRTRSGSSPMLGVASAQSSSNCFGPSPGVAVTAVLRQRAERTLTVSSWRPDRRYSRPEPQPARC